MLIESYAEIVAQAEQQPDESTPQLRRDDLRRLSIQSSASCGGSGSGPRRRKRKKNQRVTYCLNGNVFANSRLRVKFGPRVPGLSMEKRRNIRNLNFDLARPLSDEEEDEHEVGDDDDDDADDGNYSRIQGQCVEKRRNMRHLNFDQARQLSDEDDDESEFSQEKQQQQQQSVEEEEDEQSLLPAGPVCNATYALIKPNNNNNYILHNSNELPSLDFGLTMDMDMDMVSTFEAMHATRTEIIREQKRMLPTALAATNESQRSVSSSTQSSTVYLLGHHLQTSHRLPEIRITTMQRPEEPCANPHRQLIASLNGLFLFIICSVVLLLAITLYQPVHVGL